MFDRVDETGRGINDKLPTWAKPAGKALMIASIIGVVSAIIFAVHRSLNKDTEEDTAVIEEERPIVTGEEQEKEEEEEEQPLVPDEEEEQPIEEEIKEEEAVVLKSLPYLIGNIYHLEGWNIPNGTAQFFDFSIHEITKSKVFHSLSLTFDRELLSGADPRVECLWYDLREADDSPVGITFPDCNFDVWDSNDDCSQRILYDFKQQPDFDVNSTAVEVVIDRSTANAVAFFDELKANRKLRLYIRVSGEGYSIRVRKFNVQIYYIV